MPKPREYKRADGTTTYRVRFRHAGKNTSETFATEREALAFCSDVEHHGADHAVAMLEAQSWVAHTPDLDDAFEQWLERKRRQVRSDRTIHDYRRDYTNWISPSLGRRKVGAITQREVQQLIDNMSEPGHGKKGLAPRSVAHHHALLHAVMLWCMSGDRQWVRIDPCANTELPKRGKRPPKGLRPAEWQAFYRALQQIDPDAADLALFLVHSGWRWSEATGLSVWDVGLVDPVYVTMGRVLRRNAAGQNVVVDDAKSEAGQRRVKLPAEAGQMVARRMATAAPGGLLFTTKNGAPWNYNHFRERAWNKAAKVANLPRTPTPHELRHTHVWWMVLAGASLPELQSRIGHASIKTTIDVYGRMVTDVKDDALDGFGAIAAGPTLPERTALG